MRTVFCSCGQRLTASDDAALFDAYRAHADEAHPELHLNDSQITAVLKANAHDEHTLQSEPDNTPQTFSDKTG